MNLINPKYAERRRELGVPALPYQPIFDRVLVYRISDEKYGGSGGVIIKPETARGAEQRGMLVAAGPKALDSLITNGVLLGDIVWFGQFSGMFEQNSLERTAGQAAKGFVVERVESINGSDDLITRIRQDEVALELDSEDNYIYKFVGAEGVYRQDGVTDDTAALQAAVSRESK